jgi:hypothetical protein
MTTMGMSIRPRLSGRTEEFPTGELTDDDVQHALGRLAAYDGQPPRRDRRYEVPAPPPLRGRAGLWKR